MTIPSLPWTTAEIFAFASGLHAGQVDKCGRPYVEHLKRVASILIRTFPTASLDEVHAALLHDAFEDTEATPDYFRQLGINETIIGIIQLLTRDPNEHPDYLNWIKTIAASGNLGAIRVKIADNLDNCDETRPAYPGRADKIARKYEPARLILQEALS